MRTTNQIPVQIQSREDTRAALRVPKPIDVVQVKTTATDVCTARDDADFHIEHLTASNTTGSAVYVTLYLVPDGGTAGATNIVLYQKAIPAKDWVTLFDSTNMCLLQPGMTLQALCGTDDDVNIFGHGYDYQGVIS